MNMMDDGYLSPHEYDGFQVHMNIIDLVNVNVMGLKSSIHEFIGFSAYLCFLASLSSVP